VSNSLYLRTCTAARVGSWEDAPVRSHVSVDRQARERERERAILFSEYVVDENTHIHIIKQKFLCFCL
jgi:hypothetical protein